MVFRVPLLQFALQEGSRDHVGTCSRDHLDFHYFLVQLIRLRTEEMQAGQSDLYAWRIARSCSSRSCAVNSMFMSSFLLAFLNWARMACGRIASPLSGVVRLAWQLGRWRLRHFLRLLHQQFRCLSMGIEFHIPPAVGFVAQVALQIGSCLRVNAAISNAASVASLNSCRSSSLLCG